MLKELPTMPWGEVIGEESPEPATYILPTLILNFLSPYGFYLFLISGSDSFPMLYFESPVDEVLLLVLMPTKLLMALLLIAGDSGAVPSFSGCTFSPWCPEPVLDAWLFLEFFLLVTGILGFSFITSTSE